MFRRLPNTNLSAFLWRLWGESYIAQSIIKLGIPIIIGQLGSIAQQFADTIMVGQYGTMELAAAGFVNNIFNFVIYFMLGISYASTPVIGALYGKNDNRGVAQSLIDSVVVNFLFSLVIVALLLLLYHNIAILQQPEEIMPYALPYFLNAFYGRIQRAKTIVRCCRRDENTNVDNAWCKCIQYSSQSAIYLRS